MLRVSFTAHTGECTNAPGQIIVRDQKDVIPTRPAKERSFAGIVSLPPRVGMTHGAGSETALDRHTLAAAQNLARSIGISRRGRFASQAKVMTQTEYRRGFVGFPASRIPKTVKVLTVFDMLAEIGAHVVIGIRDVKSQPSQAKDRIWNTQFPHGCR